MAGVGTADNGDSSLGDMKMFGEELNKCGICLTVVSTGVKIHCKSAVGICDELFLRAARLYRDSVCRHRYIILRDIMGVYAKV